MGLFRCGQWIGIEPKYGLAMPGCDVVAAAFHGSVHSGRRKLLDSSLGRCVCDERDRDLPATACVSGGLAAGTFSADYIIVNAFDASAGGAVGNATVVGAGSYGGVTPRAIVGYYQTYRPLNNLSASCTVTVP